jgi:hypothetical protein
VSSVKNLNALVDTPNTKITDSKDEMLVVFESDEMFFGKGKLSDQKN